MQKALWTGLFGGLYSVSKHGAVPKPTQECLGEWIANDLHEIDNFWTDVATDFWSVPTTEFAKTWYATGDLLFKSDD